MPKRFVQYVVDAMRRPRVELTRHQRQLRHAVELVGHCWRVLQRQRAEGMAAELTYRTIFSLIPIVVLGLVTFRIFGGLDAIQGRLEDQIYSFFGVPDIPEVYADSDEIPESPPIELYDPVEAAKTEARIDTPEPVPPSANPSAPEAPAVVTPGAGENRALENDAGGGEAEPSPLEALLQSTAPADQATAPAGQGSVATEATATGPRSPPAAASDDGDPTIDSPADRRQVQASIRWALNELTGKVANLDFASIGVFGLLLFIYAAIALADSVENIFNLIYEAPAERPIHLRIAIHWSIITLGTGLLGMSLYMSHQLVDYVTSATGWSISNLANHILAWISSWVLLFLLYSLMPNTKVSLRASAIGAAVAATLWEVAKYGFQIYVSTAVPYSALYGSLGLIPLFLLWVYLTWLIILFGLVWTYTLQTTRGHIPTREEDEVEEDLLPADPQWMLPLVIEVALAFDRGEAITREQLQKRIGLPARVLVPMTEMLTQAGILRRLETEQGVQLVLGRPAHKIAVRDILAAGRYVPPSVRSKGWKMLEELRERADADAGERTLADLVAAA